VLATEEADTISCQLASMTGRKGRGAFDGVRGTVADSPQTEMAIDWIPVFQFLLYSVVNTPPNFLWYGPPP